MSQVTLVDVTEKFPDVKESWQRVHRIKALAIDGRSFALPALAQWRRSSREDYQKILTVMQMIGEKKQPYPPSRVSLHHGGAPIGEMRALNRNARLFFLLSKDPFGGDIDLCVCLNDYWKTTGNPKLQDQAFTRAFGLMQIYTHAFGSQYIRPINKG